VVCVFLNCSKDSDVMREDLIRFIIERTFSVAADSIIKREEGAVIEYSIPHDKHRFIFYREDGSIKTLEEMGTMLRTALVTPDTNCYFIHKNMYYDLLNDGGGHRERIIRDSILSTPSSARYILYSGADENIGIGMPEGNPVQGRLYEFRKFPGSKNDTDLRSNLVKVVVAIANSSYDFGDIARPSDDQIYLRKDLGHPFNNLGSCFGGIRVAAKKAMRGGDDPRWNRKYVQKLLENVRRELENAKKILQHVETDKGRKIEREIEESFVSALEINRDVEKNCKAVIEGVRQCADNTFLRDLGGFESNLGELHSSLCMMATAMRKIKIILPQLEVRG